MTPTTQTVLVTGATGTIGRAVLDQLLAYPDVDIRATTRDLVHRPPGPPAVSWVGFDWETAEGAEAIMRGVDAALILPPAARHPLQTTAKLVGAARASGVRHLVFLSTLGADFQPGFAFGRWALEGEASVVASGVAHTIVRPNSYMSNFLNMMRPDEDGTLRLPWGDGTTAFIDPRDVAATVAQLLRRPLRHAGRVYELTGPTALHTSAIAAVLRETSGTPVHYVPISLADAATELTAKGIPSAMVTAFIELHAAMADSSRSRVSDDVRQVTGRPPRSLEQFAQDHEPQLRLAPRPPRSIA